MAKQFIISIGREYGSGGRVIAEELAKRYNVNLYGKNLLDLVAKEKMRKALKGTEGLY
mgnify:CR=1 FL=1